MTISLVGELPEFTASIVKLDEYAASEGIVLGTADEGGVRDENDTARILAYRESDYRAYVAKGGTKTIEQFRPINAYGTSYHNFGDARDRMGTRVRSTETRDNAIARLIAYRANGVLPPDNDECLARMGAIIAEHPELNLVWGGTFRNRDDAHVQGNIPIEQARAKYYARLGIIAGGGAVVLLLAAGLTWLVYSPRTA